jgi:aminoglycoside phosphotransferase (APT) family kinase protein
VDALAELHSVDPAPFEVVCDRLTPREEVERSLDQLDRATSVTGHEVPTLRSVGDWLLENAPPAPDEALVHGDFRPGNVLFADDPEPAITGILDWETAMLGDPLTELGYLLLRWRDEGDPRPSVDDLEARYSDEAAIEDLRETNAAGLAPFTAKPGSPSRRELVDRYERRTGTTFEHERFHRAKAAFGFAVVWEDLHRYTVEAGEESDWEPYVDYMARFADSIASGEFEL